MRGNGLPDSVVLVKKPAAPSSSWWLAQSTREEFNAALKRETARMITQSASMPGENRVVDSRFGKV